LHHHARDTIWISAKAKESHPKKAGNKKDDSSHVPYPGKEQEGSQIVTSMIYSIDDVTISTLAPNYLFPKFSVHS